MTHPKMQYTYVGVDSHKDTHTAVFINCFFEKLGVITFNNFWDDFTAFLKDAQKFKMDGTSLLFGLEDTSSFGRMLTIFLKRNGQHVKHVNAYLVAGERKVQNIVQKTDEVDAECVARILLSKFGTLPDADENDKYWLLRTLVVRRDFLTQNNVALKIYLHSLLTQDFPNYHHFFCEIDGKTSLAFFLKYPSQGALKDISVEDLGAFLYKHSHGKLGIEKAQEILNTADASSPVEEIRNMTVQSTIKQIQFNLRELVDVENNLSTVYDRFETTLTSMKGIDYITASQFLSCIGDIKKYSTPAKLARYAGIAPVSYSSGKYDSRFANQRGNRELNCLFYRLAVRLIVTYEVKHDTEKPEKPEYKAVNPFFYEYYHRKMAEGKTKRQALKCVQRRLVNIIWTMLTNNEDYINPPMVEVEKNSKA